VQDFPPAPTVTEHDAASPFDDGHLWLQEWVTGGPLRFRLRPSSMLAFGDDERAFVDEGSVPPGYRLAVAHVRRAFDRQRLREGLEDPSDAVFFGVATWDEGVDYDWERTPPFLGVDVWTAEGGFRPPDAAEALFEELGLAPVNAVAKEVRADSFDPASYEVPASGWRDGRAAGVLARTKTGERATVLRDWQRPDPYRGDAASFAEDEVTEDRMEAAVAHVEDTGGSVDVATVTDRLVAVVAREAYARGFGDDGGVDGAAFRSAVAERVSRHLGGA